jgi:hypothetical protein
LEKTRRAVESKLTLFVGVAQANQVLLLVTATNVAEGDELEGLFGDDHS